MAIAATLAVLLALSSASAQDPWEDPALQAPEQAILASRCGCPCEGPSTASTPPGDGEPTTGVGATLGPPAGYDFYAVYDRLADTDGLAASISRLALSGDGRTLIFAGSDSRGVRVHTVRADGTEFTSVPVPPTIEGRSVISLAIDRDGTHAFFQAGAPSASQQLYLVTGGAAHLLLDTATARGVASFDQVQTTAAGDYVFFLDKGQDGWDIKGLAADGVTPFLVVDDATVFAPPTIGYQVKAFGISDDASTIAFVLDGFWDADGVYHRRNDVFVFDGSSTQLTNDPDGSVKERVFEPLREWFVVRPGRGMERTGFGDLGSNFGGMDLPRDGSRVFWADDASHRGRLAATDGSSRLDVFPGGDTIHITLGVTSQAAISDDGNRVAFIHEYSAWPFKQAVYIGHLNDPSIVDGAPMVGPAVLEAPDASVSDPTVRVVVRSRITDPDDGVSRVSTDGVVDGIVGNRDTLPLSVAVVHDDGAWPDATAADSWYAAVGREGGAYGTIDRMAIRLGAMDPGSTVTVADTTVAVP
jgi:hypothetical protein